MTELETLRRANENHCQAVNTLTIENARLTQEIEDFRSRLADAEQRNGQLRYEFDDCNLHRAAWRDRAIAVERAAKEVIDFIEGPNGYGVTTNAHGVRLKDQPVWCAFYLTVPK